MTKHKGNQKKEQYIPKYMRQPADAVSAAVSTALVDMARQENEQMYAEVLRLGCPGKVFRVVSKATQKGILEDPETRQFSIDGRSLHQFIFANNHCQHPETDDLPWDRGSGKSLLTSDGGSTFIFAYPTIQDMFSQLGHYIVAMIRNDLVDVLTVHAEKIVPGKSGQQVVYLSDTVSSCENFSHDELAKLIESSVSPVIQEDTPSPPIDFATEVEETVNSVRNRPT